ncbi:MAG: ComEA family DNA-binding protein [Phycisphaerae bacterium]
MGTDSASPADIGGCREGDPDSQPREPAFGEVNPDHAACHTAAQRRIALGVVALLFILCCAFFAGRSDRTDGSDRRAMEAVRATIDPNVARWYELAQLPGIGLTLAGRIVQYRTDRAGESPAARSVFVRPEDLMQVRGIGPKKVQRLRPFLRCGDAPAESEGGRVRP